MSRKGTNFTPPAWCSVCESYHHLHQAHAFRTPQVAEKSNGVRRQAAGAPVVNGRRKTVKAKP